LVNDIVLTDLRAAKIKCSLNECWQSSSSHTFQSL
jgi:hypothetical protein